MQQKYKQRELVVLFLAETREWTRAWIPEGKFYKNQIIGSEVDSRLYEVFDKNVPDTGFAIVKINEREYTVETKKEGGARWWRAFLSKEKPAKKVDYVHHPLTGELITTAQLAAL